MIMITPVWSVYGHQFVGSMDGDDYENCLTCAQYRRTSLPCPQELGR
jgi:hypothetical protein